MTSGQDLSATERADLAFYLNANYRTEWGLGPGRLSAKTVEAGEEYGRRMTSGWSPIWKFENANPTTIRVRFFVRREP